MAIFEQRGKNKLWAVRFYVIENGIQIRKRLSGYKTKKEANAAYVKYIKDFEQNQKESKIKKEQEENTDKDKIIFSTVYEKYLENAKTKLKDSSLYEINSLATLYILPSFGDRFITEISPLEILEWQNKFSDKSFAYKTKIRRHLGAIFHFAERYYDITSPMNKVENFRNTEQKKEMLFWAEEEFNQFISVVDNEIYKTFFTSLYVSGCRRGEMLALQIGDIDVENSTITICKSISNKGKNPWNVVSTKNLSSNRTIYMPPSVIKMMINIHSHSNGDFIFYGDRPLAYTSIDRNLSKYCEKSGVKKIRIHDFRHSCASLLISKGVSIVAVSKRLGHSDIEQTLNTYSHMMPSDNEMMMKALNEIV